MRNLKRYIRFFSCTLQFFILPSEKQRSPHIEHLLFNSLPILNTFCKLKFIFRSNSFVAKLKLVVFQLHMKFHKQVEATVNIRSTHWSIQFHRDVKPRSQLINTRRCSDGKRKRKLRWKNWSDSVGHSWWRTGSRIEVRKITLPSHQPIFFHSFEIMALGRRRFILFIPRSFDTAPPSCRWIIWHIDDFWPWGPLGFQKLYGSSGRSFDHLFHIFTHHLFTCVLPL